MTSKKGAGKTGLDTVLSRPLLFSMAGERSFSRGKDYHKEGRVGPLVDIDNGIAASVQGTHKYKVRLLPKAGGLDYTCSCPAAADGSFCKHCVAVGLAVLAGEPAIRKGGLSQKDVRAFLNKKSKDELASMIMEYAAFDERIFARLHTDLAGSSPHGPDLDTFKNIIDCAVETEDFVNYNSSFDYARRIDEIADQLEKMLEQGTASNARGIVELSEYAIEALGEALGSVDDSSGAVGSVLDRLGEIHLKACSKARPDPIGLANRLFDLELNFEHDLFYGAVERYGRVLGKEGTARYRELAQELWKEVPKLGPGDDDNDRYGSRFRITQIMLALAGQSGDVGETVSVLSRDLSLPYRFLQIAQAYADAGEHEKALEWAQRGIDEFPGKLDDRLTDFLAMEFDAQGFPGDSTERIWKAFEHYPSLDNYIKLNKYAIRAGEWDRWREMALGLVRKGLEDRAANKKEAELKGYQGNSNLLVEIYLWEKDLDMAWEQARTGGCSEELWVELARLRERKHPEDALPIYKRQVQHLILFKPGGTYDDAVKMIQKVRESMVRLGKEKEFAQYLQAIRTEHKAKRNLMRLLDDRFRA